VLRPRGHYDRVQRLEGLRDHADAQLGVAFDDDVERIGRLERPLEVLLTGLQADQLAHQTRALEKLEADGAFAQEFAAVTEVDDFHRVLCEIGVGMLQELTLEE
jgi:hypothetical protein